MKPGIPWSVKGIESETREAAKAAARRSGLTIGQWLNGMIQENAELQQQLVYAELQKNSHKSAKKRKASKSKKTKKRKSSKGNDFDDRLNELADQLSKMAEQSQATAVNRFVEYQDEPAVNKTLEAMIKRIETGEKRTKKSFDSVNRRLVAIDEKLAAPAKEEKSAEFSALETAMRNIVEHIETSEKRSRDTLSEMQERMSDIARKAESAQDDEVNKSAPAIAALEARVADLSAQLDQAHNATQTDTMSYIDERLTGLGEQIDAMRHSSDAMTKRAELSAVDAAKRESREVEQRVTSLIGEARNLMMKSVPVAENLTSIKGEIESLNQRFDDIKAESASDRDVQSLRLAVEQLTTSVSAGQDMGPINAMEQRLAELTRRLDEKPAEEHLAPQFNELEQRIAGLDQKLDQAMSQGNDAEAFSALETQIASVGDRLAATEESLGHLSTIEQSIAQLYTSIEENREWTQQVADGAANRMAEELRQKDLPAIIPADGAPSAELKALQDGLAAVKQSAAVSDQHNQETLEAVHETLEQIITKLSVLETAPQPQAQPVMAAAAAAAPQPDMAAPAPQANDWQDAVQSHLHDAPAPADSLSALSPVEPAMEELPMSGATDGPKSIDTSPAFDPGPLPNVAETPQVEATTSFAAPDATTQTSAPEAPSAPLDYIAQARLASKSAATESKSALAKGKGFLSGKLLPGNRQTGDETASHDTKDKKSLFSLPFLSKLSRSKAANDEIAAVVTEQAKGDEKDGGRKRLIVAGLILLIAAGGYAYSKFSGTPDHSVSAPAPAPTMSAPEKSGVAPQEPAKKTSNTNERDAKTTAPVKNISLVVPSQTTSPNNLLSTNTGMPASQALEVTNTPGGEVASAPSDPVTTSSLPPAPPLMPNQQTAARTPNVQSPLNISSGARQTAPQATVEQAVGQADLPPETTGTLELRQAAAKGDPAAQFVIASRYIDGKTMKRDFSSAASWYQKAASTGLAPAQYRLGTLFERGNGLPKDINAARLWYERAAEQGNVKAMHNLAVIYANSKTGQPDFAKARKWFEKAANYGLQDSQYNLAVIYERGLAGKADQATAFKWYSLAAARGDKDARIKAHSLKNYLSAGQLKTAEKQLASWKPQRPIKDGNFVAIKDPKWQVASRGSARPKLGEKPNLNGKALIQTAQNMLGKLGFDVGAADGIMGSRTANAVRLFQLQNGLPVNGMVSNDLLQQLQARS
jgi:localization factor PodJL